MDSNWVCGFDPDWESGSEFRKAKMTLKKGKSEAISCYEVLNVLFTGLKASPEA
jgi:hypothetical protein